MGGVFVAQARTVRAERSEGEFRSLQNEYPARRNRRHDRLLADGLIENSRSRSCAPHLP